MQSWGKKILGGLRSLWPQFFPWKEFHYNWHQPLLELELSGERSRLLQSHKSERRQRGNVLVEGGGGGGGWGVKFLRYHGSCSHSSRNPQCIAVQLDSNIALIFVYLFVFSKKYLPFNQELIHKSVNHELCPCDYFYFSKKLQCACLGLTSCYDFVFLSSP